MNANQMLLVTSVTPVNQAFMIFHLVKKVCPNWWCMFFLETLFFFTPLFRISTIPFKVSTSCYTPKCIWECRIHSYGSLNLKTSGFWESSQSSHQKSPKSPLGGISPNLLTKSCRASNSDWKNGITSFIRITQSKVTTFQKSQKSSKTPDFRSA